MKISKKGPGIYHKEGGVASTSACRRKVVEHQVMISNVNTKAKDLSQRQRPRDMPAVILVKDNGETSTLWSPFEATDRSAYGLDAADLKGKANETIQLRIDYN